MSKAVWIVLVIAVLTMTATIAQAVPPPKTHVVPVTVQATYVAAPMTLVVTFTSPKKGSDLVWARVAVSPNATKTVTTTRVGGNYVTVVRISVTAPYSRNTEFTVKYGILQTAGKSGVYFEGLAQITTSVSDLVP